MFSGAIELPRNNRPLFIPNSRKERAEYVYPLPVGGSASNDYPTRQNRIAHARSVLDKLNEVEVEITQDRVEGSEGIYLEFIGEATTEEGEFLLKVESLEASPAYHIVSYSKDVDGKERAVVFITEGKLDIFKRRIEKTFDENATRNIHLVNSIADIKKALLKSLWTSDINLYPANEQLETLWEVWIFGGDSTERKFDIFCEQRLIRQIGRSLHFLDRTVKQVWCSANTLSQIFQYSKILCELRKPADTALPIYEADIEDQYEWSDRLLENLNYIDTHSEIWLLDSGLNRSNPIIESLVSPEKIISVKPEWGVHDCLQWRHHGTKMSGVLLFGDLLEQLLRNTPVVVSHSIGSVKILPPAGSNDPNNYPSITRDAISLSELHSPGKSKLYCLAVTDPILCKAGESTAWSAEIDALAFGEEEEEKRLFIISAGNVVSDNFPFSYPDENDLAPIQDPAQSWNSITVGAYANRDFIEEDHLVGAFRPLATKGSLAPRSTTSLIWSSLSHVPIKPDIVLGGGNIAISNEGRDWDSPASLNELTTSGELNKVFDYFHSTSSATAYAANIAAKIQTSNENFWPETIRALMIHNAEWTSSMTDEFAPFRTKTSVQALLRKYGYGIPNLDRALACASNEVTLISQSSIKPYKQGSSNNITYDDCHLYDLPWPVDVLRNLGDTEIKMKVTLSYFIEPNPSRRGDVKKYVYSSCGLRFTMISPTESVDAFKARVSGVFQEEDFIRSAEDNQNWFLGPDLRTRGSLHCDIWEGRAADLAGKHKLAIYPIGGWWKEYRKKSKWNDSIRYSLIVSIEGPENATDIYNSVFNLIETPVEIIV